MGRFPGGDGLLNIYINEQVIYWLAILILNLAIIGYLFMLKPKNTATSLLIAAFASGCGLYVSTVVQTSTESLKILSSIQRKIQLPFVILAFLFFIQFAYYFPKQIEEKKMERITALVLSVTAVSAGICISLFSVLFPALPELETYLVQLLILLAVILGFLGAIIRNSLLFSRKKDLKSASALRSFLVPFSVIIPVIISEILFTAGLLPEKIESFFLSVGILSFNFLFYLSFINNTSEQSSSFLTKIIGVTLMTILIIWGNLGNFIAPYFRENYKNFNIVHRNTTLQFVPNADQSYDISSVPFFSDKDKGEPLVFENQKKSVSVSFSFSFFGKEHSQIQAAPLPAIFFHPAEVYLSSDLSLYIPSVQAAGILIPYLSLEKEKVFVKKNPDAVLFTWDKVHVQSEGEKMPEEFSVQILLKKNGIFFISYIDMPNAQKSSGQGMSTTLDHIGIFPGNGSLKESISWNSDLPKYGKERTAIAENYFTEYRKYMHDRLIIIAEMLVLISIIILFAFPYFFSLNLTKPLQDLVHAMKIVVSGNLNRSIMPIYNDEIGFLTDSFNKMIDSIRETDAAYRKFVPREFLSYVNKKKITEIKLGDHSIMEMSVMFSDLRSYTSLSEKMTPDQSFNFLNSYLGMLGPVIRRNNGFIDKYIGDAIMALFPFKPDDAVRAAVEMQRAIEEYNAERVWFGREPISAGIGIHTGTVLLGTIGEKERMEATVISDAVNLSSRLENLTKLYQAKILISMDTFLELENQSDFSFRILDKVKVKGKEKFVTVVEIMDGYSPEMLEKMMKSRVYFEEGVAFYLSREFEKAIRSFDKVLEELPNDRATLIYMKRAEYFQKNNVPIDWDGVENLEEKFF